MTRRSRPRILTRGSRSQPPPAWIRRGTHTCYIPLGSVGEFPRQRSAWIPSSHRSMSGLRLHSLGYRTRRRNPVTGILRPPRAPLRRFSMLQPSRNQGDDGERPSRRRSPRHHLDVRSSKTHRGGLYVLNATRLGFLVDPSQHRFGDVNR